MRSALLRPLARCTLAFSPPSPLTLRLQAPARSHRAAHRWGAAPRRRGPATVATASPDAVQSSATESATATATATAAAQPNVIDVLRARGLFDASTADPSVLRDLTAKPVTVYTGFDPTADSLHLGNLLAIVAMAWFQRLGHSVIALVGGATGKVGDPSGKSAERPVLDDATIAANLRGIEANIRTVLDRSSDAVRASGTGTPGDLRVVNNHDWVAPMSFLEFLRDVGKHARVNTMLSKDAVRNRIGPDAGDGMSFTEFTYQLLQAYDFMHLSDAHGCSFQLGGSDQWGNITAGTELTRKLRGRAVHGVTFPLLTTADGRKFGKSESGAVWLTADKLSPYEFYQFLFKTPDEDVVRFLKALTFLPLDEVQRVADAMQADGYVPNTAQRRLAEEVTRMVHGDDGVAAALAATAAAAPGSKAVLSVAALEAIAGDMPSVSLAKAEAVGKTVIDLMAQSGLQKSKAEARRLVKNGGAYLNNEKIVDVARAIGADDAIEGKLLLLAAGKKNKMLVRLT